MRRVEMPVLREQPAGPSRATVRKCLLCLLTISLLSGCARRRPVVHRPPAPAPTETTARGKPASPAAASATRPGTLLEQGQASWYGVPYHGRQASNGEIYDMHKLTAAHRTLPFDTVVRVTNLKNGRKTEVRIIDRGPFVEGRILDLSLEAARQIDMVAAGVAPVRLEFLSGPAQPPGQFTVQVGAFLESENAAEVRRKLERHYQPVFVHPYDSPKGVFHRVRVGRVATEKAAERLADKLRRNEGFVPFVVRLDE